LGPSRSAGIFDTYVVAERSSASWSDRAQVLDMQALVLELFSSHPLLLLVRLSCPFTIHETYGPLAVQPSHHVRRLPHCDHDLA
jgi:hypothetical protein